MVNWKIESVAGNKRSPDGLSSETCKRLNEFVLGNKFKNTLTVNLDKECPQTKLKIEAADFNELYIILDTKQLDFFKNNSVKLEPLQLTANMSIYYCPNEQVFKELLNKVEIKFVLGYAKLRTNADLFTNGIKFDVSKSNQDFELKGTSNSANEKKKHLPSR